MSMACRRCGDDALDQTVELRHGRDVTPEPGDFLVCGSCGAVGVHPDPPSAVLRQPSADEYETFLSDLGALRALLLLRTHLAARSS